MTDNKVIDPSTLLGGGSSGKFSLSWPDEKTLLQLNIPVSIAKGLAGTKVKLKGSVSASNLVRAMVDQLKTLGDAQQAGYGDTLAQTFFQPWIARGFDPFAFRNTKDKAGLSAFKKGAEGFVPDLVQNGWNSVNPADYTFGTGGSVSKTPPTQVTTAGGGTAIAGSGVAQSAYSAVQQTLANWGMGDLAPKFYDYVFNKGVTNGKQLLTALRAEPEYKAVFPGLDQYNKNNPKPMTEAQYLSNAQSYMNSADRYGLPSGFFTRQEIGKLIAGGVSPTEFDRRITNGYQAALSADDATKKYLQAQGIDMGHLLAYYLDPAKAEPMLTQKTMQAQLQGYAQNVGVQNFNDAMAQELAKQQRTNVNPDGTFTYANERKALDVAGAGAGLTAANGGSSAPTVSTTQLIGSQLAGFGGTTQPQAQTAVQQAVEGKTAPFSKGGGFTESNKGVTGVGAVQQ